MVINPTSHDSDVGTRLEQGVNRTWRKNGQLFAISLQVQNKMYLIKASTTEFPSFETFLYWLIRFQQVLGSAPFPNLQW